MLASTGATLVPPYLTIPLMDEVLIPFQNGQQIEPHYVMLLLSGLLGAALLAWGLGWAKTYLLALVSERIAPTCAPPPSSTCWACRWTTSAASAPAT
jgi:ATP-binding cassette subfamily B protein